MTSILMNNQQFAKIHYCLDWMDEGDFGMAEEGLKHRLSAPEGEIDEAYAHFAGSCISVIKALMSQTAVDSERAFEQLHACRMLAQNTLTKLTFARFPNLSAQEHSLLRLTVSAPVSQQNLHCSHLQLIEAECTLLIITLQSLLMADYGNLLHLSVDQQKSLFEAYFTLFHAQSGLQQGDDYDHEYVCGVAFTWGLVNLLFSLLPGKFSSCFAVEHFNSTTLLALIDSTLDPRTIHGRFAKLFMAFFHLNITRSAGAVARLMPTSKSGIGESPLRVYLSARLLHLQGHTRKALDLLLGSSSLSLDRAVIGTHLPCYWEAIKCLAEEQRWHEAVQLTRKLRPFPSAISSLYLEAVMIQASTGRLGNGLLSLEVQSLFKEILRLASTQDDQNKLSAFDKLALTRAQDCLQKGGIFFVPQFELLLLWDRLVVKDSGALAQEISSVMEKQAQKLTPEQMTLGWLLLALMAKEHTEALIINHVLPRDSCDFYTFKAKLELARLSGDQGRLEEVESGVFERKDSLIGQGNLLIQIAQLKLHFQ